MPLRGNVRILLLCAAACSVQARGADNAAPRRRDASERSSGVPRLYLASGSPATGDLARLRAAIAKLAGVQRVEARPEFNAVTVAIDGDGRSTESLLTAAARSAGYLMRPVRARYYAGDGPETEADLERLRTALEAQPGVERVGVSARAGGAAVRVFGAARNSALATAATAAGYGLHMVGPYVVSGPSSPGELARLRGALARVAGVEKVDGEALSGGATLLIRGDVTDDALVAAARKSGYALWPLNPDAEPGLFRVESGPRPVDPQQLRRALQNVAGIGKIEIAAGAEGPRLSVTGGKAKPAEIVTAARDAGYNLTAQEPPIKLPTLTPVAGRSTPPDFDARVLEERARVGAPAPGFTVLDVDGKQRKSLTDYLAAGKPLVLIFGSCTCPRFMAATEPLQRLYETYRNRATFLLVYIAEAHPGQILAVPTETGGKELRVIPQIASEPDLLDNLRRLVRLAHLTIPAAVDNPQRSLNLDYAGYPNRLYAISPDGTVAFKGAPGPTGLKVADLAEWLGANVP